MRCSPAIALILSVAAAQDFEEGVDGQGLRLRKIRNDADVSTTVLPSQQALAQALSEREAELRQAKPFVLKVATDEFTNLIDHLAPNLLRRRASRIINDQTTEEITETVDTDSTFELDSFEPDLPSLDDLHRLDEAIVDNLLEASRGIEARGALNMGNTSGAPRMANLTIQPSEWDRMSSHVALEDAYSKKVSKTLAPKIPTVKSFWPFNNTAVTFEELSKNIVAPSTKIIRVTSDGLIETDGQAERASSEITRASSSSSGKRFAAADVDGDVLLENVAPGPAAKTGIPWAVPEAFARASWDAKNSAAREAVQNEEAIAKATGSTANAVAQAATEMDEGRLAMPSYEESIIDIIPLNKQINQLKMERPLVFHRENIDGTGELLLERPQVRRTTMNNITDLIMEAPKSHSQVEIDRETGLVMAERSFQNPHVRDYRRADDMNALHLEAPKHHETIAVLPDGKGFFERDMEKPIAIKIVIPDSNIIETILENPGTYELIRSDIDDPERYTRSRKPFVHERLTDTHSHTFIEQPENILHERPGLRESWLDKPFVETLKTVDGNSTTWIERPSVREVYTDDVSNIEPVSPFTVFRDMFRWGPYMQEAFDEEDEEDFLNIGGDDDLIDGEITLVEEVADEPKESYETTLARSRINALIEELKATIPSLNGNFKVNANVSVSTITSEQDSESKAKTEESEDVHGDADEREKTRAAVVAKSEELLESSRKQLDDILAKIAQLEESSKTPELQQKLDNDYYDDEFAYNRPAVLIDGDWVEEEGLGPVKATAASSTSNATIFERGCNGLADYPIYYINLQHQPNRRKYMEETFGTGLNRIGATNGTNYNALLDKFRFSSPEDFVRDPWGYLKAKYNTTPAELGVLISHMDALKKAYQDGHDTVLVLEDDVGTQLCPYWPAPLSVVKKQADIFYPGWHSIQLQWTPVGDQGSKIRQQWFDSIASTRAFADARDKNYGSWNEYTVPLVGRMSTLHGNVATLWNRRGLRHMIQHHLESIVSRTRSGLGIRKWTVPMGYAATPDVILKQTPGTYTLFTAPPMFAQRFVDDQSALKNDISWRRHNLYSSIFSLQWYMELQEFYRPGAEGILPLTNFEFKVKE